MGDCIKTKTLIVEVQENGIIRNSKGRIIARFIDNIDFDGEHIVEEKMYSKEEVIDLGNKLLLKIEEFVGGKTGAEESALEEWKKENL